MEMILLLAHVCLTGTLHRSGLTVWWELHRTIIRQSIVTEELNEI